MDLREYPPQEVSHMSAIRAVSVDQNAPAHLALASVDAPTPGPTEALVRVRAISLNRGEVRGAQNARAGARPGWDIAGVVEQPAADGGGPASFDSALVLRGRLTVSGLAVFSEINRETAAVGLGRLVGMLASGVLKPLIAIEAPWSEIGEVAQQLLDRSYPGKAVLMIDRWTGTPRGEQENER
jgi:NADPH:quinone reductase-like Zn-dependent oxidoreductase